MHELSSWLLFLLIDMLGRMSKEVWIFIFLSFLSIFVNKKIKSYAENTENMTCDLVCHESCLSCETYRSNGCLTWYLILFI